MDKTLIKGLRVLEAVTETENPPRTVDELAERLGMGRSNAHRTLKTLIYAGYVVKDERAGGYRGTLRLFELGARQFARLDIRKMAAPLMRSLADTTGETVHLSVLDGMEVVYIDKIDSAQPIRAYSMIGGRAPAHAVATGKALLAYQNADYLERHAGKLKAHTKATLTSLAVVKDELKKVRHQGYAVNRGEWREGVGGLAAVVLDNLDRPIAALGISGPLDRLTLAKMKRFAGEVKDSADDLSRLMGYGGFSEPRQASTDVKSLTTTRARPTARRRAQGA